MQHLQSSGSDVPQFLCEDLPVQASNVHGDGRRRDLRLRRDTPPYPPEGICCPEFQMGAVRARSHVRGPGQNKVRCVAVKSFSVVVRSNKPVIV